MNFGLQTALNRTEFSSTQRAAITLDTATHSSIVYENISLLTLTHVFQCEVTIGRKPFVVLYNGNTVGYINWIAELPVAVLHVS